MAETTDGMTSLEKVLNFEERDQGKSGGATMSARLNLDLAPVDATMLSPPP
jgi:hypothetical protein